MSSKRGESKWWNTSVDLFYNYYSCYKAGAGLGVKRQYLALELCVYIFWQGIHGSTANGWRWEELIFEKPRTILFLRGTTEFEKGWEIDVEVWVVAVSLPVFGLILEWKPVRLVPVMRDIVCVEIDAPIVEFEAKNRWFGVFASSSLCCWPAWAHHFRSTLWFRLLKNAGKFKCVNPNMSTWKFGCDHHLWKKQSINKIWFSKIEFL